jgi:hypothetical protein
MMGAGKKRLLLGAGKKASDGRRKKGVPCNGRPPPRAGLCPRRQAQGQNGTCVVSTDLTFGVQVKLCASLATTRRLR